MSMSECKYQKELTEIIVQGSAKTLVDTAQKIASEMVQRNDRGFTNEGSSVTTSQIRNLYGASKRIEMYLNEKNVQEMYGKLILLKPKMAYANGRFNKTFGGGSLKIPGFKTLVDCLSFAIDIVEGKTERMKNFFNFFEAILAYHKAEGGK
jgi:CRISPR-associated protein Csm2